MLAVMLCLALSSGDAMEPKDYLDAMIDYLPRSREWEAWREASGELPPDFDALPSHAPLPMPLDGWRDGAYHPIDSAGAWEVEKTRLRRVMQHWLTGSVPPPPDNLEAELLDESREPHGIRREVELRFGPGHGAKLWVQLYIPTGAGPFPVFMSQDNHRGWGLIALRRGYMVCIYAGSDSRDDTSTFVDAYPEYDMSKLMRRGWAASRCLDYLEQLPEADASKVVLTGHSRNGKTSLMASAMDERFAAVISSSSGVGGCVASRYCGEHHAGEGIEMITRNFADWFHPRWRFFSGWEHKMPFDLHQLVALSAPRPCLLSTALNDGVESTWAVEQTYHAVRPVYALYGAQDKLGILYRPAGHETWTVTIEQYLDWSDGQLGLAAPADPTRIIHPHDWEAWRARAGDAPGDWPREAGEAVRRMLGDPPPVVKAPLASYGEEPDHIERMLGRLNAGNGLVKHDFMFGEYINADVYMPEAWEGDGARHPVVLWLHPWSLPKGYMPAYRRGEPAYHTIARKGFAVVCFDQVGFGRRIEEVEGFYDKWPDWSLLGKMVRDTQAVLDVLPELGFADPDQVYVVGYDLGAFLALHLAALDQRPAGYALVSPPPPFHLDNAPLQTGGIARWSKVHMLLPQLGWYEGRESETPYDIGGLLQVMAPKPTLLVTPKYDWTSPPAMTQAMVERLKSEDGQTRITHVTPETYNQFDLKVQRYVTEWLEARTGSAG